VQVVVEEQMATYTVELDLSNDGRRDAEADLVMPLPGKAVATSLALWIDGKRIEARVLNADEALQTFTDIVRRRLDPALLEYAGQGAVRARVYPVPGHSTTHVTLSFTQVLTSESGLFAIEYPFQTSLPNASELEPSFVAQIRVADGVGAVYSPTHELVVERTTSGATVRAHGSKSSSGQPLVIYFGHQQKGVSASLLSHRVAGEDGYFMLILTPEALAMPETVVSRDVILVLDTSGSMRGEKLEQVKGAASYVLRNLNKGDRFGLVSFGSSVSPFADQLASLDRVEEAVKYVQGLQAQGGTNIDAALAAALDMTVKGRPQVVLFLTDGLPTVGEVSVQAILKHLDVRSGSNVRLFSFGVGYDVNTALLDEAALGHHGTATYVRPGEDIEQRVSSLYDKISLPVLTDVTVRLDGIEAYDIYPSPFPDLFSGEQLIVVGRYRQAGPVNAQLAGTRAGKQIKQTFTGLAAVAEGGADGLPAVWAARKVGYLLAEIRLHGEEAELVDEVVALATQYGIVTPYTSFLADETEDTVEPNTPVLRGLASLDTSAVLANGAVPKAAGPATSTGEAAVEQSIAEQSLRDSERPAESATTRSVNGKTFTLVDGTWIDNLYKADMPSETISLGSARYAELLRLHPEWGRWLALGLRVTFVVDGRAYRFVS